MKNSDSQKYGPKAAPWIVISTILILAFYWLAGIEGAVVTGLILILNALVSIMAMLDDLVQASRRKE